MSKKPPRYSLSVQREAAEQVIVHHRPVAQVARQLRCSPQSVKNWIDKHQNSVLVTPSGTSGLKPVVSEFQWHSPVMATPSP